MINLSECKFGDKLKIRDGRMALFLNELSANLKVYVCVIKNDEYNLAEILYRANGKRYYDNEPSEFDIIGKWEDAK